jgi:uncharacterized membrane protein YgcG
VPRTKLGDKNFFSSLGLDRDRTENSRLDLGRAAAATTRAHSVTEYFRSGRFLRFGEKLRNATTTKVGGGGGDDGDGGGDDDGCGTDGDGSSGGGDVAASA